MIFNVDYVLFIFQFANINHSFYLFQKNCFDCFYFDQCLSLSNFFYFDFRFCSIKFKTNNIKTRLTIVQCLFIVHNNVFEFVFHKNFCAILSNDEFQTHKHKNYNLIENEFKHCFCSLICCQFHICNFSKNLNQNIKYQNFAKLIDRKFNVTLTCHQSKQLRNSKKQKKQFNKRRIS